MVGVVERGILTIGQYRALHKWVEKQLGKPMICWKCNDTTRSRYAWSNNSGEYRKEISDWERLCYSCHAKKDEVWKTATGKVRAMKEVCIRGHELNDENRYETKRGDRLCRKCKRVFSSHAYRINGMKAFEGK